MSDRLDRELSQAIKESTSRSLNGWVFTPEMRQAVHQRIAQEEDHSATPVPSVRPRSALARPITWMAAAAAALVLSFSMLPRMNEMGGAKPESASPASDAVSAVQPKLMAQSIPDEPVSRGVGEAPAQKEPEQGQGEPGQSEEKAGQSAANAGQQPEADSLPPAGRADAVIAAPPPSPVDQRSRSLDIAAAVAQPARTYLVAPPAVGQLPAPPGEGAAIRMMTASPPAMVSLSPLPAGRSALLNSSAIQVIDRSGAVIQEQPLAGSPHLAATAPDGRIAVASEAHLALFTADGQPDGMLKLESPPAAVALGPAGRIAVAEADRLLLYQGDRIIAKKEGVAPTAMTFAPDGALALLNMEASGRSLQLLGQDGSRLAGAPAPVEGQGLTFLADGQYVAAGNRIYHRSGQLAWQAPFLPAGLAGLGPGGPLVAWNEHLVSLLRPEDGVELWTAEYQGGTILQVTASTAGDQLVILGAVEHEAAVWVLDQQGGQRYAERLAQVPVGLAVEGDSLLLLMAQGLEVRNLNPQ